MGQPIPVSLTQVDASSYSGGTPMPLKVVGPIPGAGGSTPLPYTLRGQVVTTESAVDPGLPEGSLVVVVP